VRLPPHASAEDRFWYYSGRIVAVAVLVFLVAPLLIVVPMSLTSGNVLAFPLPGLSMRWYEEVLTSERWTVPARNSLIVGVSATVLSLVLGTLAAVGLAQSRFRFRTLVLGLIVSPMVVPIVISAVAFYFFFVKFGLVGTYIGLILAHTVLAAPFVVITVTATLQDFDRDLVRAAASLGAPPLTVFRRIVLPIIAPGVATGGLFAFATSFDEIVVALFLASPQQRTLPRQIFSGVREYVSPSIAAVATLLILLAAVLLLVVELLRRRGERLRGAGELSAH
jgi:putative spermidine/putrescine transport system permease protein